jgi:hypothetical protein
VDGGGWLVGGGWATGVWTQRRRVVVGGARQCASGRAHTCQERGVDPGVEPHGVGVAAAGAAAPARAAAAALAAAPARAAAAALAAARWAACRGARDEGRAGAAPARRCSREAVPAQ